MLAGSNNLDCEHYKWTLTYNDNIHRHRYTSTVIPRLTSDPANEFFG